MKNLAPLLALAWMALPAASLPADDTYFPLARGNRWRYHHVEGAGDTNEVVHEVSDFGVDGPWEVYTVEVVIENLTAEWIRYARIKGETHVQWRKSGEQVHGYDPSLPILIDEPSPGDEWRWRGEEYWDIPGKEPRRIASEITYVVEAEERVTVRAGNFTALRVRETHLNSGVQRVRWYVRGQGLTKEVETDSDSTTYEEGLIEARVR